MDAPHLHGGCCQIFLRFTAAESCGTRAVPRRFETYLEVLEEITPQDAPGEEHLAFSSGDGYTIKSTALRGLGKYRAEPGLNHIALFSGRISAHIHVNVCPSRVCNGSIRFEIIEGIASKWTVFQSLSDRGDFGRRSNIQSLDISKCIKM